MLMRRMIEERKESNLLQNIAFAKSNPSRNLYRKPH